jgi:CO/xanthine dehydrogenase Mo-binding subunit
MKRRGIGVGAMIYGIGYGFSRQDIGSATIEICEDGSVILRSGEVEFGQGSDTMCCQIAAEELGIPHDSIQLITADTFAAPNSGPSSASRVTFVVGNAVLKAARALKETLRSVAEEILAEKDLAFEGGAVFSLSRPHRTIPFGELARAVHQRGRPVVETAWHDNTTEDVDPETGQGNAFATYSYATHLAEVEVDTDTGRVEVLRVIAACDVGKAINPSTVEGQIEGGVAMGLGYGLTEEIREEGGCVLTRSLGEYMIPTSLDVPPIETHIVEEPVSSGPYGAKGVGEPALIPTAPAILNAIANALGIRVTELPASPERLRRLIREKEKQAAGSGPHAERFEVGDRRTG